MLLSDSAFCINFPWFFSMTLVTKIVTFMLCLHLWEQLVPVYHVLGLYVRLHGLVFVLEMMICNLIGAGMYCRPTGWKSGWNQILNVPFSVIVSVHACWVSHVHTCSSRHRLTNEMGNGLQPTISLFTFEKVRNGVWIAVVFALHYSSGESNILCRLRKAITVTSIFNLTALRLRPLP